jgi:hypothetical protein
LEFGRLQTVWRSQTWRWYHPTVHISQAEPRRDDYMSDRITFTDHTHSFVISISSVEVRIFALALRRAIPEDGSIAQQVFLWPDARKPRSASRVLLLQNLAAVAHEIEIDFEGLTAVYAGTRYDNQGNIFSSGIGAFGGIRLRDKKDMVYLLQLGVGECHLVEYCLSKQDRPATKPTLDCRNEKSIDTESHGVIRIRRRKIKTNLLEQLRELIALLRSSNCDEIHIS